MRYIYAILVIALAVAAGGCDSDSDDPDNTATESPPAATSTAPAASEEDELPPAIPAGTVTSKVFTPALALTVGEGWHLAEDADAAFVVEHLADDVAEEMYLGFFKATEVRNPYDYAVEPAPEDVLAWMIAHPDMTVIGEPTAVTYDGVTGTSVEFSIRAGNDLPLFNDFEADFNDRFRIIQLQTDAGPVLVAAGALDWRYYDEVVPAIDELLNTLKIG